MKDEEQRLKSWKENIYDAAKHIYEGNHIRASFKLGFTLQGIMIAIAEMEKEEEIKKEAGKDPKIDEFKDFFKSDHKSDELLPLSSQASPPYCTVCDTNKFPYARLYSSSLIRWTCVKCRMLDLNDMGKY